MNLPKLYISLIVFVLPGFTYAQEGSDLNTLYAQYQLEIVVGVAAIVAILALVALMTALFAMKAMARGRVPAEEESALISVKPGEEGVGFWRRLWNRLNDSVPVSQEDTVLTDHSYDGIRELDNRLPPWWLWGFYISIVFGVVYLLNYHVFDTGKLQEEEYIAEMEKAEAEVSAYLASLDNLIDESSVTFTTDEVDLLAGQEIFISNCTACHGKEGGGVQGLGPNLTDKYWLHGGGIKDVFKTIKYGVPDKGMVAWKANFTPKQLQQVSSYIYTLEGTSPENAREPQGELFERETPADEDTDQDGQVLEAGM